MALKYLQFDHSFHGYKHMDRILRVSIYEFTPEEEEALEDAIEARRVALESYNLMSHVSQRLYEVPHELQALVVVWPVVE